MMHRQKRCLHGALYAPYGGAIEGKAGIHHLADWNTCHQNIDLKNWRSNQKNSGFMPHEREWLTSFMRNRAGLMFSADDHRARSLHLVVQSRASMGKQHRVAIGLYAGITRFIGHGNKFCHLS